MLNLKSEPLKCFLLCFKKTTDLNSQLRGRGRKERRGREEGKEGGGGQRRGRREEGGGRGGGGKRGGRRGGKGGGGRGGGGRGGGGKERKRRKRMRKRRGRGGRERGVISMCRNDHLKRYSSGTACVLLTLTHTEGRATFCSNYVTMVRGPKLVHHLCWPGVDVVMQRVNSRCSMCLEEMSFESKPFTQSCKHANF